MMKNRKLLVLLAFALATALLPFGGREVLAAGKLELSLPSGNVGSTVTVRGTGFTGSLVSVYYDKEVVASKIRVTETASFSAEFIIPASARGNHLVKAVDNAQPTNTNAQTIFTVLPKISVDPNVARIGLPMVVSGRGFGEKEQGIKVTLDGNAISSFITADLYGTWSTSLMVPNLSKGEHILDASGDLTKSSEVNEAKLIITPVIMMTPNRGPVGTVMKISGLGFRPSEDGISITFDGQLEFFNLVGNINGSWECEVAVPNSVAGMHEVGAYGTFTSANAAPKLTFQTIPDVKISPAPANPEVFNVSGNGFGGNQSVKISLSRTDLGSPKTDAKGIFQFSFNLPKGESGPNQLKAVDGAGNSAQINFATPPVEETQPVGAPKLMLPEEGIKMEVFPSIQAALSGMVENIGYVFPRILSGSMVLSFEWQDAGKGARYNLEIATDKDFSNIAVSKTGLTTAEYTLGDGEALLPGSYYWRVQAVNTAGNAGPWSEPQQIEIELMSRLSLILILIGAAVVVGLIILGIIYWRSRYYY